MFGTWQYPLAASYSDGSWLVLPETLATFFFSVLRETSACAGRAGLGWEHGAVTATLGRGPWKSGLSGLSGTSGFETLAQGLHYRSGKTVCALEPPNLRALLLTCSHPWAQQSGLQLGSLGISTPALNKLNWMFEAFLTWHQGAPSGFGCLLGKQGIWPHAALSHRTALLPLTLARPWHT